MADDRLTRLARLLTSYSAEVQPGDEVMIRCPLAALELGRALGQCVLETKAHPHLRLTDERMTDQFFRDGSDVQFDHLDPFRMFEAQHCNVDIGIIAPTNPRHLSQVDPKLTAQAARARRPIRDVLHKRYDAGEMRTVVTAFPTEAMANSAEMSLPEYEDWFYRASACHLDDPTAFWREMSQRWERLAEVLDSHSEFRLTAGPTELTFRTEGRCWKASDGHYNFPDGEIFTSPSFAGTSGHVQFDYPVIFMGREVIGAWIDAKDGRVVDYGANKGKELLDELFHLDHNARNIGEVGIGTSPFIDSFTREMLLDEKITGTFHIAVGAGYTEVGGDDNSALHLDMLLDTVEGRLEADNQVLYERGDFTEAALGRSNE